ncbi:glycerophosphoryl diester phosphodiesterase membrane domain-containing protein [Sphingopyxis sp. MWB1]|uniref:glycerophosphoryl diester phosphodiesterase membrane domain-containing protein n=1 Tax=Sphingopyxis sp. MWB1 TaxID=1537715 RepID=UPI00051A3653|nr:glycerophosphoryl diester phosphodiesterase membrane domain-containing protein [Sphingopyxis sp. MWB1]
MANFDMGAAWEDSVALLKSHSALTGTVAAVFFFLPALCIAWFGPVGVEPPAGASFEQTWAVMQQNVSIALPYQIIGGLLAMVGSVAILRLWLSRTGISVGEALRFGLAFFPVVFLVQLLSGVAIGFGALLLIIPALYLTGRLAVALPALADRSLRNPVEAIRTSWALTQGNGWRVFFFIFLVAVVIFIIALLVIGLMGVIVGTAPGAGQMITGFFEAAIGAVGSLVSLAISAAAYRQLAVQGSSQILD